MLVAVAAVLQVQRAQLVARAVLAAVALVEIKVQQEHLELQILAAAVAAAAMMEQIH